MVKVGGNVKDKKYKKQVNLTKSGGKFEKVGRNNNFPGTWGKCIKAAKIGKKFKILKFWQMKIGKKFWEQMKLGTFFTESEKLSETGAKSETGRKCITASRGWTLLLPTAVVRKSLMAKTWYPTNFSGLNVNGKYALLQTYRHS